MSDIAGVGDLLSAAGDLWDKAKLDDRERDEGRALLMRAAQAGEKQRLDYEAALNEARAAVVVAEAQSERPLTAQWRPIAMLTMLFMPIAGTLLLALPWLGPQTAGRALLDLFTQDGFSWTELLAIGLGGYIGGRSVEKVIASPVAGANVRSASDARAERKAAKLERKAEKMRARLDRRAARAESQ